MSAKQTPGEIYGRYSLWRCNGCEWIGYYLNSVALSDPAKVYCPECLDDCRLVTEKYVRSVVNYGLHLTNGVALTEETLDFIAGNDTEESEA